MGCSVEIIQLVPWLVVFKAADSYFHRPWIEVHSTCREFMHQATPIATTLCANQMLLQACPWLHVTNEIGVLSTPFKVHFKASLVKTC